MATNQTETQETQDAKTRRHMLTTVRELVYTEFTDANTGETMLKVRTDFTAAEAENVLTKVGEARAWIKTRREKLAEDLAELDDLETDIPEVVKAAAKFLA